jgi:hypothetical protein
LHLWWASLFLAAALALAQQAALRHELGHAFKRMDAPAQLPASDTCDKCAAFSPFAGALPSATPLLPAAAAHDQAPRFALLPAPARTVVTARSRAPPAFS